ncbi:MAG: zinc-binding alcohol dehydrogenase [Caldilineaceae bacterium]|nr:zinc-binding alcohol dehydrogenase [Caldilineaceae bacterium]
MRALIVRRRDEQTREKVFVSDWPHPPAPLGNQVRIQTLYSGITNGTERNQLLEGNYAPPDDKLPMPYGYQTVGRVLDAGPEVSHLAVGDLVFVGAQTGGHLECIAVAEDDLLVKLPDSVDLKQAALFGMAAVALNTCRNAALKMGERTLVVGAGCVGQIAAQLASSAGARVSMCDVDERRLAIALAVGAAEKAICVAGNGWADYIADESYDTVLDFAGVPGMEDQLIRAVREGGQVLFIAGRDTVSYTFNLGQHRLITIKQNSHFYRHDLDDISRLVARGLVKLSLLLQDVVPAEDAKRIYDTLRDRPNELLGTVFTWQ